MNVLLTNAGRRTYFVDFLLDLKKKEKLKIHLSDCDFRSSSFYINKKVKTHVTPPVHKGKQGYLRSLISLVKKFKIELIIPLSDLDLEILSKNKLIFKNIKCEIAVSNLNTIKTCYDKIKLSKFCKSNKINYPKIYLGKKSVKNFPVILKEIKGSGSKGIQIIQSKKKLSHLENKKILIQKFIKGTEYNLDILNDLSGKFVSCCIKKKILMRAGETDKCEVVHNKYIENFSKKISKSLMHIGNLDCDLIISKNKKIFLIDLNPRFGGGYPFTHLAGLNYLYSLVRMFKKKSFKIKPKPRCIVGMKGINISYIKSN